jgi:hypothetical protein
VGGTRGGERAEKAYAADDILVVGKMGLAVLAAVDLGS